MFGHIKLPSRFTFFLLLLLLFISGTLILVRWEATGSVTANALIQQGEQRASQLEAELVTITSTGFEPNAITRPQGPFLLAVDNRSGLDEVQLYLERETGARVDHTFSRKRKLAWRDVIDFPSGTYILRAVNDESWRCRITLTPR